MTSPILSFLFILLAGVWILQYALSFFQLRRFYRRIHELKHFGNVWVGKHGSRWSGRYYGVLVVDKEKRIAHVEQFSGWTILASLKPVSGLDGRPISDLLDDSIELPISKKLLLALRNAMEYIQQSDEKEAEKVRMAEESASGNGIQEKLSI